MGFGRIDGISVLFAGYFTVYIMLFYLILTGVDCWYFFSKKHDMIQVYLTDDCYNKHI